MDDEAKHHRKQGGAEEQPAPVNPGRGSGLHEHFPYATSGTRRL